MRCFFILLFLLSCCFAVAQVTLGPSENKDRNNSEVHNRGIEKQTVYLMAIGIKEFKDKTFAELQSVDSMKMLNNYKNISNNYLPLSYKNHPKPFLLTGYVKKEAILKDLKSLSDSVDESSVVIISALSHGVIENNEYYFICSDTQSDNYASTAISGRELRFYFEGMVQKGAVVLVFWDTCHSGALFDNQEFTPNSNGSIVYFASSRKDQEAKEIYKQCKFTNTVMDVFLNKNPIFLNQNNPSFVTIGRFMDLMPGAVDTLIQKVTYKSFSNDTNIGEFPIIQQKTPVSPPSIWQHPKPFSPIAVSPNKSKWLDYGLIGVESASLIGMIVCGPILQPYYKNKISSENNVFARNDYREKGKNAAIGFCISTGLLVSSYIFRTLHVRNQFIIDFKERQFARLDLSPVASPEYNGLALVINF